MISWEFISLFALEAVIKKVDMELLKDSDRKWVGEDIWVTEFSDFHLMTESVLAIDTLLGKIWWKPGVASSTWEWLHFLFLAVAS